MIVLQRGDVGGAVTQRSDGGYRGLRAGDGRKERQAQFECGAANRKRVLLGPRLRRV